MAFISTDWLILIPHEWGFLIGIHTCTVIVEENYAVTLFDIFFLSDPIFLWKNKKVSPNYFYFYFVLRQSNLDKKIGKTGNLKTVAALYCYIVWCPIFSKCPMIHWEMLVQCWPTVYDTGPNVVNVSCFLWSLWTADSMYMYAWQIYYCSGRPIITDVHVSRDHDTKYNVIDIPYT